ncbi:MAG: NAD-dependent epimerase/dehydratase family protein [Bacteroidia bacterium]
MTKVRAIVTGATGMVGEGVMHECLQSPEVDQVLVINRKSVGIQHPKLKEILHADFSDFSSMENQMQGYNSAFMCMGITSLGASEELYTKITHDYTLALAKSMVKVNPEAVICYVSGKGTKQEPSKNMWIRVKGRTEKDLQDLCKNAYMFRPGYIKPMKGMKNTYTMYKVVDWFMFPLMRLIAPGAACTLKEIGRAMIYCAIKGYQKKNLEVKDIEIAAKTAI